MRWLKLLIALLLASACNGGFGCGGCGGGAFVYPEPAPAGGQLLPRAATGRLKQSGLDFITSHLAEVLRAQFPTRTEAGIERAVIYLSEAALSSSGTILVRDGCIGPSPVTACPARLDPSDASRGPTFRSKVELNLDQINQSLQATMVPASGSTDEHLHVVVNDFDLFVDVALVLQAFGGNATCRVHDAEADVAAVHVDQFAFDIFLAVDAENRFSATVANTELSLGGFGSDSLFNLDVDSCDGGACNDPTCNDGWISFECQALCGIGDFVFTVADFFFDVLSPLVEYFLPPVIEGAMQNVLAPLNGAPLAVGLEMNLADVLESTWVHRAMPRVEPLAIGFIPNDDAFTVTSGATGQGLNLSLHGGFTANAHACVPTVAAPNYGGLVSELPALPDTVEIADATGTRSEGYDLALTWSAASVQQLLFGAYQLGGLCLSLAPSDLESATGGLFKPTIGSLQVFAAGLGAFGAEDAPVYFAVHPTQSAVVTLGQGTAESPHLSLDFGDVGLSIYAQLDADLTRLTTIAGHLKVALSLLRAPNNSLHIVVESIGFDDVAEIYNESLAGTDFAALAEVVFSAAVSGLLESSGGFEVDVAPMVSSMLGGAEVFARINTVQHLGAATGGYLGVFVTLCDVASFSDPTQGPCYDGPDTRAVPRQVTVLAQEKGRVRLQVDRHREYQVKVDGSAWTWIRRGAHTPADVVELKHPYLLLPGTHTLHLRSQHYRDYTRGQEQTLFVDVP